MYPVLAFVVAHYHASGRVSADLRALVQALAALPARVVFVSTGISDESAESLRPHAQVIARDNVGYDFWSYRVGIEALGDLSGIDRLVVFNSSFVTLSRKALTQPFLAPVGGPCLHGLSRCAFGRPHLQSYWVAFEHRDLLRSTVFERWWSRMTPVSDRLEVIRRYEMGMSAYFERAGVPLRAAFEPNREDHILALCRMMASRPNEIPFLTRPAEEDVDGCPRLDFSRAARLNPTHFLWDRLVRNHGIVKLDLLRNNPFDMSLQALRAMCAKQPRYQALIDDALAP
jgi:hypothetical protein